MDFLLLYVTCATWSVCVCVCVCVYVKRMRGIFFLFTVEITSCLLFISTAEEGKIMAQCEPRGQNSSGLRPQNLLPHPLPPGPQRQVCDMWSSDLFSSAETVCCTTSPKAKACCPFQDPRIPHAQLNQFTRMIPEAKSRKVLEKARWTKSSSPAQNLQPVEQKKSEARAHSNLLSMCIIFFSWEAKIIVGSAHVNRISNPQRGNQALAVSESIKVK